MKLHNYGEDLISIIKKEYPLEISHKEFNSAEKIYDEGDTPHHLFFIDEGLVSLTSLSINGQEALLRVFGKGFIFGHRSLISDEHYHASAHTLCKTKVLMVPKEIFYQTINNHPKAAVLIAKILAKELRRSELRLKDMSGKKVYGRIIEALIFLKNRYPDYQWTRREIGEFSGAKTETVSRVLGQLEQEGHIYKEGRAIHIKDPVALLESESFND